MKKRFLQCFLCMALLIMIAAASYAGNCQSKQVVFTVKQRENDIEKAFGHVLCSCVRIQGNGHYGSGNILKISRDEVIVVTNKHMVSYLDENSYVTFYDGVSLPAGILYVSDEWDVAFLRVERDESEEKEPFYRCVRMDADVYRALEVQDTFFMIDIATDLEKPEMYSGEVLDKSKYLEDYQVEMFYGDAYAKPGMSGCGLFDERGNYIGMLSGATPYVEIAAVGLDKLIEEYEKVE